MTDKEMLELAAKAAGKKPPSDSVIYAGFGSREWNPLISDGDALRLAVELRIKVTLFAIYVCAWIGDVEAYEDLKNDPYAATRRAIVRAAAEIGAQL